MAAREVSNGRSSLSSSPPLRTLTPKGAPLTTGRALAHSQVDEVKISPQEACEKAKAQDFLVTPNPLFSE